MNQLLILSGKGGTGKTTIAGAFIKLLKAKAYADCDVDAPNLHLISDFTAPPRRRDFYGLPVAEIDKDICIKCGSCFENCRFEAIDNKDGYLVEKFACEGCGVCEFVCPVGAAKLKPAAAGELMLYKKQDEVFSTAQLKMGSGTSGLLVTDVKKQLKSEVKNSEIAIIDGSPGIGCPVIASITGVDMVLIVAEPSVSGISDMRRIIDTAAKFGVRIAVCINKFDTNIKNTQKIKNFCKESGISYVGEIPFDKEAVKATNDGKTIVEIDSISSRAVKLVYDKTITLLLEKSDDK